ncbi:MAG TPA: glycosyltransferase family 4 protein, partial [Terriglobia bacterium]|nr:glycosyltransferase family 4 protein [Terriglobia bacterium]
MKVLVLTPPLGSAGGIQRYTLTLVRAIKELFGEESVHVVSMSERAVPQAVARASRPWADMARMAMPQRKARVSVLLKLRFGWQAIGAVARWSPDLIICTHLALGPVGWLAATVGERPYWIVAHGIEAWGSLPYAKRAALRQADQVVVTSAFNREQVVKRQGIDRARILNLPCALDESLLRAEASVAVLQEAALPPC